MTLPEHGIDGSPFSYWIESTTQTNYPSMPDGVQVDVAILGGGIAGITAAVLLKERGLKVAIIEAGRIACLASGHTTAHISASSKPSYYRKIIDKFGVESARACARSALESIEKVSELVNTYGIECDFSRASEYLYGATEGARELLRREAEIEARIGLPIRLQESAPLPYATYGAIQYQGQAEFHPRKYLLGLAATIPGDGCHVFEQTRALSIREGEPCTIHTDHGTATAHKIIIATGSPISVLGLLFARMTPYRSYVLGLTVEDEIPEHTMFYSTEEPCHYIRQVPSGMLLVGGEDHVTGGAIDTKRKYVALEKYCNEHFRKGKTIFSWSTQDQYPFDNLPFIGLLPCSEHQYVATGFKGTGMTYGTLSGMIISDLITNGSNPYASLYSPRRLDPRASGHRLLTRNLHVGEIFARGLFKFPDPLSKMDKGEAKIVEVNGKEAATYRDDSGNLHAISPVCTHLACQVRWNNAELTWDCPCHGSRYDIDGKVISAPTVKNLAMRNISAEDKQ